MAIADARVERTTDSSPPVQDDGLIRPLSTGVWFGLVVGLLEIGLVLLVKRLRDPSPGFFRLNRHVVWMAPTVNLALFGGLGLALGVLSLARPRWASRVGTRLFAGLGVLTLILTYPRLFLAANVVLAGALGVRIAGRIERNAAGFRRLVRLSLPVLAVVTAVLAGTTYEREVVAPRRRVAEVPAPASTASRPNVLLVVLDTVRADRLSLYGYERPTTPNLERLAKRGVLFEHARSTAPWTLPSHASMLTGRWPHQLSADIDGPLDGAFPTLGEFLGAKGYATAGIVGNLTYTGAETGLARGFSLYVDHEVSPLGALRTSAIGKQLIWPTLNLGRNVAHRDALAYRKDAAEVNRQFLGWLDGVPKDRPFFAFLNFFDAHDPYIPPPGYESKFGPPPGSKADKVLLHAWFIRDKATLAPREVQLVKDAYDACLFYLDEQIGRLVDDLERRGRLDDTLVMITADHGEHFGAHGLYGHASSLYAQETRVPLLILPPKGARAPVGRAVDPAVSLRDLPATVADLTGLGDGSPFPGRSLAAVWSSAGAESPGHVLTSVDEPVAAAPNQGRSPVFRGAMKAVVVDDHVYIRNGDGVEELYHTEEDPLELKNLAPDPQAAPLLERSRARLERILAEEPGGEAEVRRRR